MTPRKQEVAVFILFAVVLLIAGYPWPKNHPPAVSAFTSNIPSNQPQRLYR